MNILLIGNGFDLEHDLPTKYKDFLEFIIDFDLASRMEKSLIKNCKDEYIRGILEDNNPQVAIALKEFIRGNLWIKYFKTVYNERLKNKENWIDFESEISYIIQTFDDLKKYYESSYLNDDKNQKNIENCINKLSRITRKNFLSEENLADNIKRLINDLDRLIGALEIYIFGKINNTQLQYYNPDIVNIYPDKLISFNYSNTYRLLYSNSRKDIKYDFIHGKAKDNVSPFLWEEDNNIDSIRKSIEKNNMVLGIDEYLLDDRKNKEIDFISFKKYYQRIYKQTGNRYKKWLEDIDKDIAKGINKENTLFIFGHSLDVTDGDILRDLINHKNVKTVIYYRNKETLGQQIANLVKVLNSDEVIEKVYGNNPIIEFRLQSERKKIIGSEFEIISDTIRLENIYMYRESETRELLSKIRQNIDNNNIEYFYSQEKVITLYDILQKIGLSIQYGKDLFKIACSLICNEGLYEPKKYSYECWEYTDFNNFLTCDAKTKGFIDRVNQYNINNFVLDKKSLENRENKLIEYEMLASKNEEIDKDKYIDILNEIFNMFDGYYRDKDNMWKILVKISLGPALKIAQNALQELIDNSKDEYDIVKYNNLLSEIAMQGYFDSLAETQMQLIDINE